MALMTSLGVCLLGIRNFATDDQSGSPSDLEGVGSLRFFATENDNEVLSAPTLLQRGDILCCLGPLRWVEQLPFAVSSTLVSVFFPSNFISLVSFSCRSL